MTVTHLRSENQSEAEPVASTGEMAAARGAVLVAGRIPAFCAGMASIVERAGFAAHRCTEPAEALRHQEIGTALITVESPGDVRELRTLTDDFPELVVVAVLLSTEPEDYLRALRAGAHTAVGWCAGPAEIVDALCAAQAGKTVLPTGVARAIARSRAEQGQPCALSETEIRWLRGLTWGESVVALARSENYSQREVFRRLADLYQRMGARNRQEAIALAGRWGLLDLGTGLGG
ncbi:LuxR C-terminal-related transcriptional regulator [Amycolatopsis sp. H20-H5]|uniref:LuxR C-terminal-related transcriptional regulator n=1 Tax=Amycolatopsis sp. H20-H5 TaxID=3046309 RepID=UPI002DBF011A|nr:LuxR C-terminal-related transcriptional regulator [Amycolatopsis sp. H20-H5]MEC3976921.1 LuxR C-terminal-related transcriptional regulator [Amycolatopsis sp. H20-H5]